eukprot:4770825-Lingulodinium_polyedra.AAC.1
MATKNHRSSACWRACPGVDIAGPGGRAPQGAMSRDARRRAVLQTKRELLEDFTREARARRGAEGRLKKSAR